MIIIIATATLILPSDDIAENNYLSPQTIVIYGSGLVMFMMMMMRKNDENYENIGRYYQK